MKMETYVEALHEVVENCNRQDDGEENWRRDGDDCQSCHYLSSVQGYFESFQSGGGRNERKLEKNSLKMAAKWKIIDC